MNDEDQGVQALDNEMLESAVMNHRLEYPLIPLATGPGTQAMLALMLAPDGRIGAAVQTEQEAAASASAALALKP